MPHGGPSGYGWYRGWWYRKSAMAQESRGFSFCLCQIAALPLSCAQAMPGPEDGKNSKLLRGGEKDPSCGGAGETSEASEASVKIAALPLSCAQAPQHPVAVVVLFSGLRAQAPQRSSHPELWLSLSIWSEMAGAPRRRATLPTSIATTKETRTAVASPLPSSAA